MLLEGTTVPVGLLLPKIIILEPTFVPDDDPRGYRGNSKHEQKKKTNLLERRGGGREGGKGGGEKGAPTYLCRIGTQDSAVPRKTTSPGRFAPARRPRSSAKPWDCCCCSFGDCCSAGPVS